MMSMDAHKRLATSKMQYLCILFYQLFKGAFHLRILSVFTTIVSKQLPTKFSQKSLNISVQCMMIVKIAPSQEVKHCETYMIM